MTQQKKLNDVLLLLGENQVSKATGITYYKLRLYGNDVNKFTGEEVESINALWSQHYE